MSQKSKLKTSFNPTKSLKFMSFRGLCPLGPHQGIILYLLWTPRQPPNPLPKIGAPSNFISWNCLCKHRTVLSVLGSGEL